MLTYCLWLLSHNMGRVDYAVHKVYNIYSLVPYETNLLTRGADLCITG